MIAKLGKEELGKCVIKMRIDAEKLDKAVGRLKRRTKVFVRTKLIIYLDAIWTHVMYVFRQQYDRFF